MSMSTPGGAPERIPSTSRTDRQTGAGKPPADGAVGGATAAAKPGGANPGGAKAGSAKPGSAKPGSANSGGAKPGGAKQVGKGSKGRKPIAPVKVGGGRNWGPIALIGVVVLIAAGIIGYGAYASTKAPKSWEERADNISGMINYRKTQPELVKAGQHKSGPIPYTVKPPVAGEHNPIPQTCMGNVYDAPIANEHAVHSLEHGAVWITYKAGMPAEQVARLAEKVQGKEKMFMSPVEGLDSNVSLQAWGYQLKVDTVDDDRIDEFIRTLRVQASVEGPTATCDGGVTATGTAPQDVGPQNAGE